MRRMVFAAAVAVVLGWAGVSYADSTVAILDSGGQPVAPYSATVNEAHPCESLGYGTSWNWNDGYMAHCSNGRILAYAG